MAEHRTKTKKYFFCNRLHFLKYSLYFSCPDCCHLFIGYNEKTSHFLEHNFKNMRTGWLSAIQIREHCPVVLAGKSAFCAIPASNPVFLGSFTIYIQHNQQKH